MKLLPHGLILAGMSSSSGKTALTCMLLAALREKGIEIQPFKVGPDFIDPGYHASYAGLSSINLDAWMMGKEEVLRTVRSFGAGKISIVEGVMGLFDGASPTSEEGSTMELARRLNWPILLVVSCDKAGRSIGAAIRGFIQQAGENRIQGVLLNRLGSKGHAQYMKDALSDLDIPILGVVADNTLLQWPERHLGLQASSERSLPEKEALAELANTTFDIPKILSLVSPAPEKKGNEILPDSCFRIGIAKDEAFHFYYPANLEYLKLRGAELVTFSPLHDKSLPSNLQGLLLGGGFPEVYAEQMADNESMRKSLAKAIEDGMPCYAECGGLMILSEALINTDQKEFPMVGTIPGKIQMTSYLNHFGYSSCTPCSGLKRQEYRGHEFHYSRWLEEENQANLWYVTKKYRGTGRKEGFRKNQLRASYIHLYFPTASGLIDELFGFESIESV